MHSAALPRHPVLQRTVVRRRLAWRLGPCSTRRAEERKAARRRGQPSCQTGIYLPHEPRELVLTERLHEESGRACLERPGNRFVGHVPGDDDDAGVAGVGRPHAGATNASRRDPPSQARALPWRIPRSRALLPRLSHQDSTRRPVRQSTGKRSCARRTAACSAPHLPWPSRIARRSPTARGPFLLLLSHLLDRCSQHQVEGSDGFVNERLDEFAVRSCLPGVELLVEVSFSGNSQLHPRSRPDGRWRAPCGGQSCIQYACSRRSAACQWSIRQSGVAGTGDRV